MGFSRQEYWSGFPFPSPGDLPDPGIKQVSLKSLSLAGGFFKAPPVKWKLLTKDSLRPHGLYTVYGILQACILEWIAFLFSRGSSEYKCSSTRKKTETLLKGSPSVYHRANPLLFSFSRASQGGSRPPGMLLKHRSWLSRLGWWEGLRPCKSEHPQWHLQMGQGPGQGRPCQHLFPGLMSLIHTCNLYFSKEQWVEEGGDSLVLWLSKHKQKHYK